MLNQYSSKSLESGCILSDLVTLVDHLRNHDFEDTQSKRILLATMLFTMSAEANLLRLESPFQILRNKKICETI